MVTPLAPRQYFGLSFKSFTVSNSVTTWTTVLFISDSNLGKIKISGDIRKCETFEEKKK